MTDPVTPAEPDVFEEASRWCLRRREATDDATEAAYQVWVNGGPGRLAAVREAEILLEMLHEPALTLAQETRRPPMRKRWQGWAMAASVLIVALGVSWYVGDGQYHLRGDAVTAVGETRTLTLADGSRIILDTESAVKVVALGTERRVRLDRGQAFFQVAKDPHRPFIVETPAGTARVLGTAFDVRRYEDGRTRVSVVEGAVEVAARGHAAKIVLRPGHGAWLDAAGTRATTVRAPAEVASWRQGQLIFYRAPLNEVVAELRRYHKGSVIVGGKAAQAAVVSGVFNTQDIDGALDGIAASAGLKIVRVGNIATFIH